MLTEAAPRSQRRTLRQRSARRWLGAYARAAVLVSVSAMCRLFGFRSVIQSQVHRSLVSADNAIGVQSEHHPDGWGVAYYVGGAPHLVKSAASAVSDRIFQRVSGVVASETVVAHVRKATHGELSPLNAHPFQYGRWIFAHNGNLRAFSEHRAALEQFVHPGLRRFVLGTTDSELFFYLLLSRLDARGKLQDDRYRLQDVAMAAREAVDIVTAEVGPMHGDPDGEPDKTYLTFIITNGRVMLGHQGGKRLYLSTWKHRCPDRDECPSYGASCEAASTTGFVNHLVMCSEPLHGENVWQEMALGDMVGVDAHMRLQTFHPGSAPPVP